MPRPDLAQLGVGYRRIPVLAIGRNVYCDSRLILRKLEEIFPDSRFAASPFQKGIEALFESYTIDGGVFWRAVTLLPYWRAALLKDPAFRKDRSEMMGRPFGDELLAAARPEGLEHIKACFELMEKTFLADGRQWILGNEVEGPSLADIQAVWPFHWLVADPLMEEGLPAEVVSEDQFPRTFAWIRRFDRTVKAAQAAAPKVTPLTGAEAVAKIKNSQVVDDEQRVDSSNALGLRAQDQVEMRPTDGASGHCDKGALKVLTFNEMAVINDEGVHVHYPRWNFQVKSLM